MNKQADVQAECIGTLSLYPELFQHSVLKAEYFTKGYAEIYAAMNQCYRKSKALLTADLMRYKGFNIDLYMSCTETGFSKDINRFRRVQQVVIDRYKERCIKQLSDDLRANTITLSEYDSEYRKIIDLHTEETSRVTADDLIDACKGDKKNIFFHRFRHLGGLMKLKENDFVIVAGVTGGGKSGLALNLLEDLSADYRCLYFNLEMVEQELLQRLIAIKSGLLQDEIAKMDKLSSDNQNKATATINEFSRREIHIISKSQTLDTIRANIALNDSKKHLIVIIDHIGLIGTKARNSYERMTEIAKELRKYSLDFNCTIIGLCQLNRDAIKSNDGPKLSMLRDSGEIEQSASKVVFVWNDDNGYSLVLLKNRSGRTGLINVHYNKGTQRMEEYS